MSKMSDIAMQLDEQVPEYGFESYLEALEQGFNYEVAEDGTATLTPPSNGLEMAHEAWLAERDEVVKSLTLLRERAVEREDTEDALILGNAILFIKEQCHD